MRGRNHVITYKATRAPNPNAHNDVAIYQTATKVNARVWDDTNLDGLMVGEPGLANVPVQLYQVTATYPDGQLVAETTTDSSGDYLFDDLAAGDYYVVSGKPDPTDWWKFTRKDFGQSGSDDIDNDSDADRETDPHPGRTHTFTLDPGEVETWVDIGQYKLGTVGNWVWNDYYIGGDGIQNNNYGGYDGLDVILFSTPSGYGGATTTVYGGQYWFDKVELVDANWLPIIYQVQFTKPPDGAYRYVFAPQDQGGDDTLDSDADPTTGLTGPFSLPVSGAVNLSIDCGIQVEQVSSGGGSFAAPDLGGGYPDALAGVAGQMWVDEDRDGVRDPGELPVPGWRVRLFTAAGALAAETWTGWDGTYRFADVADGQYRVRFDPPVGGVGFTRRDRGNDDTRDSDADPDGYTALFTYVGSGPGVAHLDAGLVPPGGRVRGAALAAGPTPSPQWVGIDPFGLWGDDKDDDPAAVIAANVG
ncbi:MAG TPA: SdrD B-like domain-containing protein [Fimbriiglobus sp.]|nr:SdrD B-like domain-containing protein [Fimbriiglobus sp.]